MLLISAQAEGRKRDPTDDFTTIRAQIEERRRERAGGQGQRQGCAARPTDAALCRETGAPISIKATRDAEDFKRQPAVTSLSFVSLDHELVTVTSVCYEPEPRA